MQETGITEKCQLCGHIQEKKVSPQKHHAYHPERGVKEVETGEYEKLLQQGWYDSPANFPLPEMLPILMEDDKKNSITLVADSDPHKRGRGRPPNTQKFKR